MGEIKSVKVDNWGVFFLQKLQNFFNKTDYCDLTLQFRDNSQLKVHRLVLSACTDFFNVLEQTCELIDDALVMPIELQADVVVPIVNFMYTGTLEFELKMYGKLLKTAKEMNMTVLLKLLEAHKRTMEGSRPSQQRPVSPKTKVKRLNAGSPSIAKYLSSPSTASSAQQRRVITSTASTTRRILTGNPMQGSLIIKQGVNYIQKRSPKLQKGPTRFESSDSNMQASTYESSFDAISYESKPLKEEELEYDEMQTSHTKNRSSPFEQLRKGYNNNKRPAISTFTSPPAKKPNIEDVKEFSEQQRMRKQIAAEYGDEAEYDGIMDDEFHNDDDDDEPVGGVGSASISTPIKPQNPQMQQQPQASIIIKQSPNEKPTIVVKDSSNSKMDHAKIISEVLRQYPHLVKSNKNIKLKIMPNPNGQAQKIIVKKEQTDSDSEQGKPAAKVQTLQQFSQMPPLLKTQISKPGLTVTSTRIENQTTAALVSNTAATTTTGTIAPTQKRRIDSKTMHSLIALGAENTTGPWLCLRCGVNGRPISIPSYRGFRRHLINTHKEAIDPALCEHCGWRSANNRSLHHHMVVEHKITSAIYVFPKCDHCGERCLDANVLNTHIVTNHPDAHKQQCIYCNKVFSKEMQLYTHMKTFHKKLAREDGVIDFSDEEMTEFEEEIKGLVPQPESSNNKKIKIISDISLPSTLLKLDEVGTTVEEEYTSDTGPKFVNADGNEMVLTAEQREEIMSQLEQDHHDGGVVMVLNETGFPTEGVIVGQEIKLETAEAFDDHNIYNEFSAEREGVESDFAGNENDNLTEESALEAVKAEEEQGEGEEEEETQDHNRHDSEHEERMEEDHMEWAENVISAHDVDEEEKDNADEEKNVEDEEKDEDQNEDEEEEEDSDKAAKQEEVKVSPPKQPAGTNKKEEESKTDDISLKLKMLTGDWSDDEIDEDGEDVLAEQPEKDKSLEQSDATEDIRKQTIEYERTQQQESSDKSNNKREEDLTSATETVTLEEETSQSAQSEKTDEHNKKSSGENLTQHSRPNLRKSTEDKVMLDASEGTKMKGKLLNPLKEKPASKEASARVENEEEEEAEEEQNKLDDFNGEDAEKPLNVKVTPPKKNVDDPLDSLEKGDDKSQAKNEIDSDKYEGIVTSTKSKDDSLKTADKLKSIMSEWVDDEDDN